MSDTVTHTPSQQDVRKVVLSSFVGTGLEWYDFFLFGNTTAIVFAPLFFPGTDPVTATISALLVNAVAFVARPFGAVLFGHLGDKTGRKHTLVITIALMGICSALMGILPTYAQIGVVAPILLTILRIGQGVACGGEWGGAMLMALEYAPEKKRGMYGSIVQMGSPMGNVLATGAIWAMGFIAGSNEAFLSWGWRVPYIISIGLVFVGLYIRRQLNETPAFREIAEQHEVVKTPFVQLLKTGWARIIVGTFVYLFGTAGFYMMTTFGISYWVRTLKQDSSIILGAIFVGAVIEFGTLWIAGQISNRTSASMAVIIGYGLAILMGLPFFFLLHTKEAIWVYVALILGLGIASIPYGPSGAVMSQLFPTNINYSGIAVSANMANVVAGAAPPIAAAIVARSDSPVGPTILLVGLAVASFIGALIAHRLIASDRAKAAAAASVSPAAG